MITVLAAAQDNSGTGGCTLLLVAVALVLGRAWYCWHYPRRACRDCGVSGKTEQPRSEGKYWAACDRCGGNGWEYRPGYRVLAWLARRDERKKP